MNSLESVRIELTDYLEEASICGSETQKYVWIRLRKGFAQRVYEAFFNLIIDPTLSPESIIHILDTYTSGLDGFSTNKCIQFQVAFACFEALAKRRPKALNGSWETLAWVIVNYSSFSKTSLANWKTQSKQINIETLKFITEFGSPELCPNPCLRLELFRLIRSFNCNDFDYDHESFRDMVINTLLELCDNYSSLTIDQIPNVNPMDLQYIMKDNYIDMGFIMNHYDLELRKSELITAVLKLTRNLALIVKDKHQSLINQADLLEILFVGSERIESQLFACLSFCGLLPSTQDDDYDKCLVYLVQAVGNDSIIQNYVIDTLDAIAQVSISFPDNDVLQYSVPLIKIIKDKLLHTFLKIHIYQLPALQYRQEMYGGLTQAEEYRLRYFQNNTMDQYNDSDKDSECYASNENDYGDLVSEENESELVISD